MLRISIKNPLILKYKKKMANEEQTQDSGQDFYSDIAIRLRDLEEKQAMIKDRVLLMGENLISDKEETEKEIGGLKIRLLELDSEIKKLRMAIERIIDGFNNVVRKNEFEILKSQFEMFQPLEIARIKDVEAIVNKVLKKQSERSQNN